MHQPVYEPRMLEYHDQRLVRMLGYCLAYIKESNSYALSASMLSAYAERFIRMENEIGEMLT